MKATGIVRRIDDLGRVVIPKEIRRTLHIREGDPLEIYTDREGEIIFKKYSPIGEMGAFAKQYAESLSQTTGHTACITDRDVVIAAGAGGRALVGKKISKKLETLIQERITALSQRGDQSFVEITEEPAEEFMVEAVYPIISEGYAIGSVALLSKDARVRMGEVEQKVAESAAGFLGRQMEQ